MTLQVGSSVLLSQICLLLLVWPQLPVFSETPFIAHVLLMHFSLSLFHLFPLPSILARLSAIFSGRGIIGLNVCHCKLSCLLFSFSPFSLLSIKSIAALCVVFDFKRCSLQLRGLLIQWASRVMARAALKRLYCNNRLHNRETAWWQASNMQGGDDSAGCYLPHVRTLACSKALKWWKETLWLFFVCVCGI